MKQKLLLVKFPPCTPNAEKFPDNDLVRKRTEDNNTHVNFKRTCHWARMNQVNCKTLKQFTRQANASLKKFELIQNPCCFSSSKSIRIVIAFSIVQWSHYANYLVQFWCQICQFVFSICGYDRYFMINTKNTNKKKEWKNFT